VTNDEFLDLLGRLAWRWLKTQRADEAAAEALLRRALEEGIASVADEIQGGRSHEGFRRRRLEEALVRASGMFDEAGYVAHYLPVLEPDTEAVEHYCLRGWKAFANPGRGFDSWWYRFTYTGLDDPKVNPLVHYLLVGRREGLLPLPPPVPSVGPVPGGGTPRRVCLYAGYDLDGLVDDYVVAAVRELSRFADVYYLADGYMSDTELAKLAPYTKGAWSHEHGAYDFGSAALLAGTYVGWDVVATYDELIITNDSYYVLRPLDEMFARMDAQDCDWWGLQATKRDHERPIGDTGPADVIDEPTMRAMVGQHEWSQLAQLHLSSYLLCLRRPAFEEPGVRKLLEAVQPEQLKSQIILKYEIGLSRVLVTTGHRFATYVEGLYPYHPLYTPDFFDLAAAGFPLLKRNFISENARDAPDLIDWKARVLAAAPEADVDLFERNLLRVSPDERLQRSFAVTTLPDGTVGVPVPHAGDAVLELDRRTPTYDHWWAFPVCAYDHTFAGNERAVFEQVRDDPSIKKIVLTRSRKIEVTGENVEVVPLMSPEGQELVVRSRFVFVKHTPRVNVPYALAPELHDFIALWHGIPLKRFGMASLDADAAADQLVAEHLGCRSVITSSAIDTLAMTSAFYPLTHAQMWQTGLPRNDLVNRPTALLPPDLAEQRHRLERELAGRRLVMFLPTFKRDQDDSYYRFTPSDLERLDVWAKRHDAAIGLREHMADRSQTYARLLAPLGPLDLSSRRYPDLEVLYALADGLISDYSSCLVDFMLTGRPLISFAYDLDRYSQEERGLFYDLDEVLPGPVCRTVDDLVAALDDVFVERTPEQVAEYDWKRRIFFEHLDDGSARRVVTRVRELALSDPR
jgi:CDP-glycerol glycerophosphotransferase (TagB/SpsB family)